jgi:hypothetical protein
MGSQLVKRYLVITVLAMINAGIMAQERVPLGIHYQAVARDNYGNELVNKKISVKFSIVSGDPLGTTVYQELHQDIYTSKFGVFSLIIGHGVLTGGASCTTLSEVAWETANHYLKVEVKFDNDFMDMGTMQFLAVPYALYAQRSLEPGPEGPKGDQGEKGVPGDPASDNQTLSFDGSNLTISGTNSTVNMTNLLQNLEVSTDGTGGYNLALTRGNTINLATIEKDGDPTNEIQDLVISDDKIKITKNTTATEWPLTKYLDNTDKQELSYDAANRILSISGGTGTINLSELKNDADASITNEIQDLQLNSNILSITGKTGATPIDLNKYLDDTDDQNLTFVESTNTLSIDGGNSVTLGSMVAFRAKNTISDIAGQISYPTMTYDAIDYNVGDYMNLSTGIFRAPVDGIYTFNITYYADGTGDGREISLYVNSVPYEKIATSIAGGATILVRSVTMRLSATNTVSVVVYTGLATQTGTCTFSGYKVN